MKSTEEALKEFRQRNTQLMQKFDQVMEIEKIILSQMTRVKTTEEIQHLDTLASCCEQIAREILVEADGLAEETKVYLKLMMEEP